MTPGEIDGISKDAVESALLIAVTRVLERDALLLSNETREEAISHRLAVYLEASFPEWHVDTEYNRLGFRPKRLSDGKGRVRLVRPDILVHMRNTSLNLLAIEVKKAADPDGRAFDIAKLRDLRTDPQYAYRYAVFINFLPDLSSFELQWV